LRQSRSGPSPLVFFPFDVCATAKKGPIGLLSFSLSFIYCSILFPFVFGAIIFAEKWRFVLTSFSLFSKNNDFAENFRHFHSPRVRRETIHFPWIFCWLDLRRRLHFVFKRILIHFSGSMLQLLRQRHLPLAGKLVTVIWPKYLIQLNLSMLSMVTIIFLLKLTLWLTAQMRFKIFNFKVPEKWIRLL
jgi:hypothetical protein